MTRRVAIVGGGAAGIYAALGARSVGAEPVIFERNARIGIKILISGGGKCNITHDASPRDLEQGFLQREARFLRYALHELTPADVLAALDREGVETMTRPNGRVFPVSGRADDVVAAFERMLADAGVDVRTEAAVEEIVVRDGTAVGVVVGGCSEAFDAVIVTTGGMSYRKVGTTGDGIRWGRGLEIGIEPVRAALAPIYFPAPPPAEWQGVALRDVTFWVEGEARAMSRTPAPTTWRGDLLLTHRGVSGPTALEVSRAAALMKETGTDVELLVDVLPDTSLEDLRAAWDARMAASGRSEVQTFVESMVPRALVPYVLAAADVPVGLRLGDVNREARTRLLGTLKRWCIGVVGTVPMDRGEVTAGGIALDAVAPTTMESRAVPRLYFAGEVLDVAGCVGGYNLQAAFSTGWVAGRAQASA